MAPVTPVREQEDDRRPASAGSHHRDDRVTQMTEASAARATTAADDDGTVPWPTDPPQGSIVAPPQPAAAALDHQLGSPQDPPLTAEDRELGRLYRRVDGDEGESSGTTRADDDSHRPSGLLGELASLTPEAIEQIVGVRPTPATMYRLGVIMTNLDARASNLRLTNPTDALVPFLNVTNGKEIPDFPISPDRITAMEPDAIHRLMGALGVEPMNIARWDLEAILADIIGLSPELSPPPPVFVRDDDHASAEDHASSDDDESLSEDSDMYGAYEPVVDRETFRDDAPSVD